MACLSCLLTPFQKKEKLFKQASLSFLMVDEEKKPEEAKAEGEGGEAEVKKKAEEIEATGK